MDKEARYKIIVALNKIEKAIENLPTVIAEGIVENLKAQSLALDSSACSVPGCASLENLVVFNDAFLCGEHYNSTRE